MRCREATPAERTPQSRESRSALCFEKGIAHDGEALPALNPEFGASRLVHVNFQNVRNTRMGTGTGPTTFKTSTSSATSFSFFLFRLLSGMVLFAQSQTLLLSITMMIMRSQFRFPLHLRRGQYRGTAVRSDKTSIFIAKARLGAGMAQFFAKTTIWRYM